MSPRLLAACLILFTGGAFAQDAVSQVDAANARCEAARAQRLEPIRQRLVAQCQQRQNQPTAGCETYYSTWGDNSNHANGSVVRGRFYDLPECRQARALSRRLLQTQD